MSLTWIKGGRVEVGRRDGLWLGEGAADWKRAACPGAADAVAQTLSGGGEPADLAGWTPIMISIVAYEIAFVFK